MDRPAIRIVGGRGDARARGLASAEARAQTPDDPARLPLRSAIAADGCTGCFTTRRTRFRTSSSVIPRLSSSRRWATTSTSSSPCRSPRPTRTGSRSIAAISCREPTCSRRSGRRGSTSCSPGSRLARARSRSNGPPISPALAESRRQAILETLQQAVRPIVAERVVDRPVAVSGRDGSRGRQQLFQYDHPQPDAPRRTFPLPPTESAAMGVH